jgi:hypothetical protein
MMRLLRPWEVPRCNPAGSTSVEAWLFFSEGYERTESDHAEAGGYALIATETRAGSQACAKWGSKGDDEEVGSGVQRDRHGA